METVTKEASTITLIFLGGTCGGNNWRAPFTEILEERGIPSDKIFNPVVSDWNPEAQAAEEKAKALASHHVYCIADPRQDGNPISAYSILEAAMALYDKPETAVVVFDTTGMSGHPLKAMDQARKVLQERHPEARIFGSTAEALIWLAEQ